MKDFSESDLRTTAQLLEMLRKYQEYKGFSGTDYRLAKVLGITPQRVAQFLQQGGIMNITYYITRVFITNGENVTSNTLFYSYLYLFILCNVALRRKKSYE